MCVGFSNRTFCISFIIVLILTLKFSIFGGSSIVCRMRGTSTLILLLRTLQKIFVVQFLVLVKLINCFDSESLSHLLETIMQMQCPSLVLLLPILTE